MPEIDLDGRSIEYEFRQSSKASRCRIDMDLGGITVVIPEAMNLGPEELLREKEDWVLNKKEELDRERQKIPDRTLAPGETIPYLDEPHVIRVTDAGQTIEGGEIRLSRSKVEGGLRDGIIELYREEARAMYGKYVENYENEIESDYDTIYIRNQKTKWASCSSKKNLSFNLRLMMAPEEIIEYVTVHEMVHLDIPSHSKEFWNRVESVLPDFRERRDWLKEHSPRLVFSEKDLV